MPDVRKLQAEAEKKGLHGEAEQRYVGGVFNRIRQAHSRATTPGSGARHLNRAARKEARREAQNRRDRLMERANGEAFRLRARTRREEGRTTAAKAGKAAGKAKPAAVHERYAANVNGVDLSRNVANIESYERAIAEAKSGKMGAPASEVPGIVQRLTTGRDTEIARYKEAAQKAAKPAAPTPKPQPARAPEQAAGKAKPAKPAAMAAPATKVVNPGRRLVFGVSKPPKEPKEKPAYTPKQQEVISEIEKWRQEEKRASREKDWRSPAGDLRRRAEDRLRNLNKAAYLRYMEEQRLKQEAHHEEVGRELRKLHAWNMRMAGKRVENNG